MVVRFSLLAVPLAVMLALPGCLTVVPGPGIDPGRDACGANALQALVGQPAAVLEGIEFGVTTRVIRPGMAVTMDYSPSRLNIEIDGAEVISRVACG